MIESPNVLMGRTLFHSILMQQVLWVVLWVLDFLALITMLWADQVLQRVQEAGLVQIYTSSALALRHSLALAMMSI